MSLDEDEKEYELKDLIVQTLEANGLLPKIKAQIRSSVFLALDESEKKDKKNLGIQNVAVNKILSVNEGRTAASLVRDFLEKSNLDYTLSVFDPELNSVVLLDKRDKLLEAFKISDKVASKELPILIELIKLVNSSSSKSETKSETLSEGLIDAIKSKFDYLDVTRRGLIDEEKARNLFYDFFPNFHQTVLDNFLNEELTNTELLKGIDFQKFLSLFKKWYFNCQRTFYETENIVKTQTTLKPKSKQYSQEEKDLLFDESDFKSYKKENKPVNDVKSTKNGNGMSNLGELPPLNALNNANNNKKVLHSLNKELDKKNRDDDDNYDDDFTSGTTPRTPNLDKKLVKNRGALVSDDDIEDNLSYVEESSKIDENTIDKSISTIQNNDADYIEDISLQMP